MGLDVVAGILSELRAADETEALEEMRKDFDLVNEALRRNGLPEHREPTDLPSHEIFSARIGTYGCLHALRRLGAYLWAGRSLPEPADLEMPCAQDPILQQLYRNGDFDNRPLFRRLFSKPSFPGPRFEHLILHSDAEGYYVPIDFPHVIDKNAPLRIQAVGLGSSLRLLSECEYLAGELSLPLEIDPDSDDFDEAITIGDPAMTWQRYPIESSVCLHLIRAARASIRTHTAIVFC